MKQLVILSGKGGTGKTSVAAALAHLVDKNRVHAVLADADVDAPNLELVLHSRQLEEHEFFGGTVAIIDQARCQGCGTCQETCRFEAISYHPLPAHPQDRDGGQAGAGYIVDPIACDGCAACVYQCPEQAIRMEVQLAGRWFRSHSRYGAFIHAELKPAQENSGKLVTMVKQQARLLGLDSGAELVLVDGPPGIGCPVISAAAGADLALIVTEPTQAGIYDLQRVLQMVKHFRLPAVVCINKADIYPQGTNEIRDYCKKCGIEVIGSIPYDEEVMRAMVQGEPVTAYRPASSASRAMVALWERLAASLGCSAQPIQQKMEECS
jgi:MinD superfamily P-loop ATPase